jgi:hypothetical protein
MPSVAGRRGAIRSPVSGGLGRRRRAGGASARRVELIRLVSVHPASGLEEPLPRLRPAAVVADRFEQAAERPALAERERMPQEPRDSLPLLELARPFG